jgi:hypothetical protein
MLTLGLEPRDIVGTMLILVVLCFTLCFLAPLGSFLGYEENELIAQNKIEPLSIADQATIDIKNTPNYNPTYNQETVGVNNNIDLLDNSPTDNSKDLQAAHSVNSNQSTSRSRDSRSDNKTTVEKDNSNVKVAPGDKKSSSVPRTGSRMGDLIPWNEASRILAVGDRALITDVETGLSFRVQRRGGSKHADCQPLTAEDTAVMRKIYGGQWSWARRAIVVSLDGKHMAASMNGMPHGAGAIKNNDFDGHFCIHFLNSRTHESNKLDSAHQAMVKKAAGK